MIHCYVDKNSVIRYVENMPEEEHLTGSVCCCANCQWYEQARYDAQLSSIEFEEQRLVKAFVIEHVNVSENRIAANLFTMSSIKPDTFYSFQFEGEVRVIDDVAYLLSREDIEKSEARIARFKARIARFKEPPKQEESQEEM
jgi:hypothetical protein